MLAAVLPGRAYPTTAPALALVVEVLERHGHDVRAVQWAPRQAPTDPVSWVTERLLEAVPDGCGLVAAKSLGCWAAPYAARQGLPGMWLTPVLTDPTCAAGIRGGAAPQLVVGGLADPMYDPAVAATLGCDVLEVDGADHALSHDGDTSLRAATLTALEQALDAFLVRLS